MHAREGEFRWTDVAAGAVLPAPSAAPARREIPHDQTLPTIELGGIRIHAIDEQTCIRHILAEIDAGAGGFVVTPNVDHLRRCRQQLDFSVLVSEANLVVADGMPLVWASRLQGTPLPQRVAGSDLISSLSAAASAQGRSIFLLGGDEGTAESAAKVLVERHPGLKICGTLCPPLGFEKSEVEVQTIIQALQAAQPDIVYVALGSPKQEYLIERVRRLMPRTWWLGVGVSFSFLCGHVKRAPVWMQKCGLEWVHRLLQEPGRLMHRYLFVGIPFASALLIRSAMKGLAIKVLYRPAQSPGDTNGQRSEMTLAAEKAFKIPPINGDSASSVSEILARMPAFPDKITEDNGESSHSHEIQPFIAQGGGKLRGLVLLGGMVRQNSLGGSLGRSALDLPVGNGKTILTRWLDEAAGVAKTFGLRNLPVRLLVDLNAQEPKSAVGAEGSEHYRLERDTSEYRGTGGLLANIAVDYGDDDMILVGNAAHVLLDPLAALTVSLMKTRGVVGLIGHRDGEPSGLMLITCKALRLIPSVGFVDMKEQALPIIASKHDVRVVQCRRPTGLTIRTLSDYIGAVRAVHQPTRAAATDPWAEDWKSTFVIVEAGASVAPSARIHDSIVLAGASIDAGAVVVRSVVAGSIRKDREVVDQCVEPGQRAH